MEGENTESLDTELTPYLELQKTANALREERLKASACSRQVQEYFLSGFSKQAVR